MPTYRYHVMLWEDTRHTFTVCLLDEEIAAYDLTREGALRQLKDYLVHSFKEDPDQAGPDFTEPALVHFDVPIRPEYRSGQTPALSQALAQPPNERSRVFPHDEELVLRVCGVRGRLSSGLRVCALPTIGPRFYYHEGDLLKGLVAHYTQMTLRGLTPRQLSRYLHPGSVFLDEVVLRLPARVRSVDRRPWLRELEAIAEPIDSPRGLEGFSGRAWEREAAVAEVVEAIFRERANVVLVGESGTGKTTVLREAVRRSTLLQGQSAEDGAPSSGARAPRFWRSSGARLIAGAAYLGQWEQRCETLIARLADLDGTLCIENLLDLVRLGGQGPRDGIGAFLVPFLQHGELRMVAEATPAELDACRRLLPGLADLFRVIRLGDLQPREALAVLRNAAALFATRTRLEVEGETLEEVYRLFRRFLPYRAFPGPAVAFLDNLFGRLKGTGTSVVTRLQVVERFVLETGLPEFILRDDLPLAPEEVFGNLRARVKGQDDACEAVTDVVSAFKAGLNDPERPLGVMHFCGPTGVGKTLLARTLADYLFGHGLEPGHSSASGHGSRSSRFLRLDMSEYSGWGAAERLSGVSGGEPSALVRRVREQPFLVLLLDEIEKAAPEVFDILLSVLDEGRLTDSYGRTTTFRSAVIIMTSNLGVSHSEPVGFGASAQTSFESAARAFFRPEFFNRIDRVVPFRPLEGETIREIAGYELSLLGRREGLLKAGLRLEWTDAVVDRVVKAGFDRRYGARPLQRAIETLVSVPLARFLVAHPGLARCLVCIDAPDEGPVWIKTRDR